MGYSPSDDMGHYDQLDSTTSNVSTDLVIYYVDQNQDGQYNSGEDIVHSAVVAAVDDDGNTTVVTGKMGYSNIAQNHPDAPNYYDKNGKEGPSTTRAYFREKEKHKKKREEKERKKAERRKKREERKRRREEEKSKSRSTTQQNN